MNLSQNHYSGHLHNRIKSHMQLFWPVLSIFLQRRTYETSKYHYTPKGALFWK
jgi:hypothetical protein